MQIKNLLLATALSAAFFATSVEANTITFSGTILKSAGSTGGTSFDTWNFNILSIGQFTVDLRAYEASQSSTTTAGYYTQDLNGDGELTWLDPDTYFYKNTGNPLQATDAIVRCDDTANNCAVYQNGLTAGTSPLVVTTHQQNEASQDGSIHFRRDPWFDVNVVAAGNYKYLVADYLLSAAEAQGGINASDSFSAPSNFVNPILDHADYQVTLSSNTLNFALAGNTITVTSVPVPSAIWLFGSTLIGLLGLKRKA